MEGEGETFSRKFPLPPPTILIPIPYPLRHPVPDQRHGAHADGKRAEQAAFFVPADEQGGEGEFFADGFDGQAQNDDEADKEKDLVHG